MIPSVFEFEVEESLRQRGISRIAKEGSTIVVVYSDKPIRFDIDKSWQKTAQNFQKISKSVITKPEDQQLMLFWLSDRWYGIINNGNNNDNSSGTTNATSITANKEQRDRDEEQQQQKHGLNVTNGTTAIVANVDPYADLDPSIPDRHYAEFAIRIAKKLSNKKMH
jgi:hypothetical protein